MTGRFTRADELRVAEEIAVGRASGRYRRAGVPLLVAAQMRIPFEEPVPIERRYEFQARCEEMERHPLAGARQRWNVMTGQLIDLPGWASGICAEDLDWFERQWAAEDEWDFRWHQEMARTRHEQRAAVRTEPRRYGYVVG